jgi:hypothetical protein
MGEIITEGSASGLVSSSNCDPSRMTFVETRRAAIILMASNMARNIKKLREAGMATEEIVKPVQEEETKESPRHRLQLDFSPEAYNRLLEVRRKSEARTNAEVVRNALRLYDWFLEQKHSNYRIQLVKDGVLKEVEIVL